ncbi:MAG: biosynthetic peptidoglycan transglycosylase, partial [Bacteroidota bacterium]
MGEKTTQTPSYGSVYRGLRNFIRSYPRSSYVLAVPLFFAFLIFLFIQTVSWGLWTEMPSKKDLQDYPLPQASEVYTVDGVLIGRYFLEDRINIPFDSLPPHLVDALLATEDIRFYEHDGVDKKSLARVLIKSLLFQQSSSGGGSTLSQQVAKNFYPRENFSILSLPINKVKESLIAHDLEEIYSKEEIIALYLNTVSFGGNEFGIEIAARNYFHKEARNLLEEESALLIGMLKAPTYYNPLQHPERAKKRRDLVLSQMKKYEMLSESRFDSLTLIPLK